MKKITFCILFVLSFFLSFSQLISYEAIWLKDGMEDSYVEVEEFWSLIKEQAISDDTQNFWVVSKVLNDDEDSNKPDYIVMNGYKDSLQMNKGVNWEELAKKVYKNKLSKSKFKKKWDLGMNVRKETKTFLVERLDNTTWTEIEGGVLLFNGFQALNDDYEDYEMKFFKNMHEKNISDGSMGWWEFNRVIKRSNNANQDVTHFTMDVRDLNQTNELDLSFSEQMLVKHGVESRKRIIGDTLQTILFKFKGN
ncbi:MAG: hypothetical protein CMC31_01230 [Flavobacteriaceae bacterium]|nr:hypothetical protein [Flavobacteriaceae bacterium]RCL67057.1 MAG: hypothetical protein DBW79_02075 [Cryomorphaceae bacterium]|tara:strand:+ start:326 stop:1078 length:753 start_codon:yes stop_codon:yes gene_type:complete